MNRRLAAIALVALLALAGFGIRWAVTDPPGAPSGPPAPIRIGSSAYELSALLYIADDQGHFTANGLDATLRPYGLSTLAIRGMESGDADISLSGEYSIVQEAFQGANISVIACIDKSQNSVLIYRNDRGIETVPDLRGKRIGISRATQSEFTFGRYLDLNDLSPQDVTLVDLPSPQYVEAIANGTVDGVVSGYSYVDLVRERLGRTASFWRIYQSQPYYWVMAGQNDWIAGHPEAVERLLRSLVSAEEYAVDHPADARAIVGRRLNHTDAYMAEVWPNHHFSLSLDESLVIAMEDEARWMIANNLTNATTPPDLRKYIDTTALAQVDPGAVTIL